jgi:ABC-type lipoprotein release transport system permease subunit
MTPRRLLRRSLQYHRGIFLAVALGVAVGTAVLAGALVVGDSVRGSLRSLTLDRLGEIDHALVSDRYFREELAGELAASEGFAARFDHAAPALLLRGSVEAAESGSRASSVSLIGADERFWSLFTAPDTLPGPREVLINEALARETGAGVGDAVLVRFQTDTLVPSESVMGRKSDNVRTLRLTVAAVLADRGAGRFGLSPSQQLPFNAFVSLNALQRAVEQPNRVNAMFASGHPPGDEPPADEGGATALAAIVREELDLADLNLELRPLAGPQQLSLQTDRFVLDQITADAAGQAARQLGLGAVPVLTYLANSIEIERPEGTRGIPYSTVSALEFSQVPASLTLRLTNGEAAAISGDEILLNDWAARDLAAKPGESIKLTYYVVNPQGALETQSHVFTLRGVVVLDGLAADGNLAPEMKGMSDSRRMGEWNPPFPVDLGKIRPIDEDYWDRYRTAPKAFVPLEIAKQLWTSRFGQLTSLRIIPKEGQSLDQASTAFEKALREAIDPAAYGLQFQPVKAQGLEASAGATDFSGLFVGFSLFLIVSAAMLVALLFRLGIERRAKEIGLLLSTGQPVALVRRLLLEEGAIIAAAGCLAGLPFAAGYAALMVYGLRTWWSAAVGGSFLELHVTTASLISGALGALLLMVLSIWLSVRKLERLSPRSLLAGNTESSRLPAALETRAKRARLTAAASASLAAVLVALSLGTDAVPAAAGFFGVGALLLVAALAWFRARLFAPRHDFVRGAIRGRGRIPLARLGARNASRYPARSVLSAGLIASASFVIVAVAANRHDVTSQEPSFHSGDGGFRFIAESDVPIYGDQLDLDLPQNSAPVEMLAFRVKPGEDASCLNLYRPSKPTLLGAPPEMIRRGGFAFQSTIAATGSTIAGNEAEQANPWLLLEEKTADEAIPVFGDANSVQWILHLGLGQELEIRDEQGEARRLVIAGTLSRSIFQSQLILSEKHFLELFPSQGGYNLFLVETDSPAVSAQLEERFADRGLDATGTADRLAGYLVVENTYLSTFQTLGGLGLLLGTLGLAVVMVRNVIERRGELALLQAVGFSRGSISWLVLAENGFLLVFGVIIGAATALLAVAPQLINGQAEPPWLSLSATLLLILAVGLIAGAAAVAATIRSPIVAALRGE